MAVSISLACAEASIPVALQLYLPQVWTDNPLRRQHAAIPEQVQFAIQGEIALAQIETPMH